MAVQPWAVGGCGATAGRCGMSGAQPTRSLDGAFGRAIDSWNGLGEAGREERAVLVIENAYWMQVSFGVRVLLYPRYITSW
jgi:hypothetical protein